MGSAVVLEEKRSVLGLHERAAEWLRVRADPGRAPRTIDACARGLAEYLLICERDDVAPVMAGRLRVAVFVKTSQRASARSPRMRASLCRASCVPPQTECAQAHSRGSGSTQATKGGRSGMRQEQGPSRCLPGPLITHPLPQ